MGRVSSYPSIYTTDVAMPEPTTVDTPYWYAHHRLYAPEYTDCHFGVFTNDARLERRLADVDPIIFTSLCSFIPALFVAKSTSIEPE